MIKPWEGLIESIPRKLAYNMYNLILILLSSIVVVYKKFLKKSILSIKL